MTLNFCKKHKQIGKKVVSTGKPLCWKIPVFVSEKHGLRLIDGFQIVEIPPKNLNRVAYNYTYLVVCSKNTPAILQNHFIFAGRKTPPQTWSW